MTYWTSILSSQCQPSLLNITQATCMTFTPVISARLPFLPAQMDGPERSCKELPGSTEPCLCTDTSSATWSSSCSKDLDEAWLTVVGGSSVWGISVPLYIKKGKISGPRYGYHSGFRGGSPDWEWRNLSPFVCPRRASQVPCNAGLSFAEVF